MKAIIAALCGFFIASAYAELPLREMSAEGNGAEFVITNQPCDIDFHEPTNFKYRGYVVTDKHTYEACWYGEEGAIWMAVDEVRQIVSLDPTKFKVRAKKDNVEYF